VLARETLGEADRVTSRYANRRQHGYAVVFGGLRTDDRRGLDHHRRHYRRLLPLAEYRRVIALGNLQQERLIGAFGGEVLLQPLAKHRGVYADDIVAGGVVVGGAAEDAMADFLFVDLAGFFVQHAVRQVYQHVAQPDRPVDIAAGCYPFHQQPACVRDVDGSPVSHSNPWLATIITHLFTLRSEYSRYGKQST